MMMQAHLDLCHVTFGHVTAIVSILSCELECHSLLHHMLQLVLVIIVLLSNSVVMADMVNM